MVFKREGSGIEPSGVSNIVRELFDSHCRLTPDKMTQVEPEQICEKRREG